jgi:hypothetical protein
MRKKTLRVSSERLFREWSQNTSMLVSIATGYALDGRGLGVRFPIGVVSRPALGPIHPSAQWAPEDLSPGNAA